MTINLLPWREQQLTRRNRRCVLWCIISIVIMFSMTLGVRYYLNYWQQRYQLRNLNLAKQITDYPVPNDEKKLTADYQIATQQIQLIQAITINQIHFWHELSFLQQKLPINTQLTHLSWIGKLINLQGTTNQPEQVGLLVKSLEKSHFFSQVILEKMDQENQTSTIHFVIHADRNLENS